MIRRASIENLEEVYNLLCELEDKKLPFMDFNTIYSHNLSDPAVYYFVAEQGGEVIGFASLHIQHLLHHCSAVAEVQELVVKSGQRSGGIGSALFQILKDTAAGQGCGLLEVCCNQRRERSHRFYTRCGMSNSHYKFTYELKGLKDDIDH